MVSVISCKKIDTLQQDSAAIYNAKPQLILTGLLLNCSDSPWSTDQRHNQYMVLNFEYYGGQSYNWTTGSFGEFDQLRNVVRMEVESEKAGATGAPYAALAKFFKAYFFTRMTERFGDIPMSEALKGTSNGNFNPKYDDQKLVYQQILNLLEESNNMLSPLVSEGVKIDGDFYYGGNLAKWQKLVNSFKLRVLTSLSKRANETDLDIKKQFSEIVNNTTKYPLILDNSDNFQLVYNGNNRTNNYPLWPADGVVVKYDNRNTLAATYVNIAKQTKDPRLMVVAWPTDSARKSGDLDYAEKFTSYRGGLTGDLQSTLQKQTIDGKLSMINFDYWMASPSGIPCVQLGAYETHLNIAEAINRGWLQGDAADHYRRGIKSSMEFYGVKSDAINSFMLNNVYQGNNSNGLKQILNQKYIAFFQNSGLQAYYQFRRTGIPQFDIGPSNANNNAIPVRWAYPTSEYTVNEGNIKAAIAKQFGGGDTQNGMMWLIK
ncbi:SusD-like starch-binding protein associating with outer membrane [Sphingobacterium detergens]|uniref:SusD-like starch-binding protein associating with outer membrane n=2 Tax=Sphingobacterium detergens TaxID=1145106 RepID=A0A420BFC4_SPHD1|nr:SusD-like starch-binding protein associating with outer membrane [Sphingobacterium detergens]